MVGAAAWLLTGCPGGSADPPNSTTDTGDVPDCKMYGTEAPCVAVSGCFWYAEIGQCVSDCELIKDEATCKLQDYCEWFNEQCTLLLV